MRPFLSPFRSHIHPQYDNTDNTHTTTMDSNSTPLLDATIRASEPFPQPRFSQGSSSRAAGKLPKASPEPSSSTDKATQDHHDRLQPPEGGMFWKKFLIVHYRQQRTIATLTKELTRSHKKVKKAKHHRSEQFRDLRQELHMALVSVYRLRKQNMKYRRILSVAVGKYPLGKSVPPLIW